VVLFLLLLPDAQSILERRLSLSCTVEHFVSNGITTINGVSGDQFPLMSTTGLDSNQPIKVDFPPDAQAVVVAFGSRHAYKDSIPFEWTRTLESLPVAKIYVRDIYQIWYLKGLPGIADSPQGVSDYLCQLIGQQGIHRIVTMGGSMGGYAALLFGCLMGANEAHAFAGQTFLPTRRGRLLAKAAWKRKWPVLRKHWELIADRSLDRKYFDLKPLLRDCGEQTSYHVYYSTRNEKDVIHAQHLANMDNVRLYIRSESGHFVARGMKKSGELDRVLRKATGLD
jgi:hypothetical protein